jgi:uncharacterized membrane protein
MDTQPSALTLGKSRLEALSDGVFAIAMTLLVLELKVPEVSHHHSDAEMVEQLRRLGPDFFAFVATFLISGSFWFIHHITFHFIRHTDRMLCWINLFFLMFVSLLPFSAGLLSHLLMHPVSQFFYFGNQLVLALILNLHWHYAIRRKMIADDAPPREIRRISWRVASLAIAFAAPMAATAIDPKYTFAAMLAAIAVARIAERVTRRPRH